MLPINWNNTKSHDYLLDTTEKMPDDLFAKIITAELPLDYYDQWVSMWYAQGGETYLEEWNNQYQVLKNKYRK